MILKTIIDEDLTNYKKPSMLIATPRCTMKCGEEYCQNNPWLKQPDIRVDNEEIIKRYLSNNLTQAIVFSGLDPMDTFEDLLMFVYEFRAICNDDVVIYTGYTKDEIKLEIEQLKQFPNIIVKFGRYIPEENSHHDEILGVELASSNQYAERL